MNHSHPKPSLPIASHSAIQGRPAVHPQVAERLANTLGCIQREADADSDIQLTRMYSLPSSHQFITKEPVALTLPVPDKDSL